MQTRFDVRFSYRGWRAGLSLSVDGGARVPRRRGRGLQQQPRVSTGSPKWTFIESPDVYKAPSLPRRAIKLSEITSSIFCPSCDRVPCTPSAAVRLPQGALFPNSECLNRRLESQNREGQRFGPFPTRNRIPISPIGRNLSHVERTVYQFRSPSVRYPSKHIRPISSVDFNSITARTIGAMEPASLSR